jgi:hypothetical protein
VRLVHLDVTAGVGAEIGAGAVVGPEIIAPDPQAVQLDQRRNAASEPRIGAEPGPLGDGSQVVAPAIEAERAYNPHTVAGAGPDGSSRQPGGGPAQRLPLGRDVHIAVVLAKDAQLAAQSQLLEFSGGLHRDA